MPRVKQENGGVAVEEVQEEMFPELDMNKDSHKALLKAAKKFAREKADRDALLSTSKEKTDAAMQKLIGLMHEAKLEKFRFDGVTAEVFAPEEKAIVKIESDDDAEEDED